MISVKEALEISVSEKLSKDEQKIYDLIINHIDRNIRDSFNGISVSFTIDGGYIDGEEFHLNRKISKSWRRTVLMEKWKKEYQALCWKIDEEQTKDRYGYQSGTKYTFSIDSSYNRDQKLIEIGIPD